MHFEFDQSAPIYKQLADQMEEMIFSGLFLKANKFLQPPNCPKTFILILRPSSKV